MGLKKDRAAHGMPFVPVPPQTGVTVMRRVRFRYWLWLGLIVLFGASLRFTALETRPIHADEAVQAFIFADLLEAGTYVYDPQHYHGPLPHYLNLKLMPLLGVDTLGQMQVWHLRVLAALAGSATVLLCALGARPTGGNGLAKGSFATCAARIAAAPANDAGSRHCNGFSVALRAALLAVLSPLGLYYSRMGIHETLLVLLALITPMVLFFFLRQKIGGKRQFFSALLLGLLLGALHATKETWCIIVFSWAVAAAVLAPSELWRWAVACGGSLRGICAVVLAAVTAFAVSAILYSGVGQNWQGVADAWLALFDYRTGSGHDQPWYYYFEQILGFYRSGNGFWGEGVLSIFALFAVVSLYRRRRTQGGRDSAVFLPRFLALGALVQIVVYSSISYKTPWLMLVAVAYLVPLAAWGWEVLARRFCHRPGCRVLLWVFVLAGSGAQAWLASFVYPTDQRVPFVYAPTLPEADAKLVSRASQFTAQARQTGALAAVVGDNYWPLPWYFRKVASQVGYFENVPANHDDFTLLIREGSAGGGELLELRPGYLLRLGAPADVLQKPISKEENGYFRLGES